jgi:hypothetical protein
MNTTLTINVVASNGMIDEAGMTEDFVAKPMGKGSKNGGVARRFDLGDDLTTKKAV